MRASLLFLAALATLATGCGGSQLDGDAPPSRGARPRPVVQTPDAAVDYERKWALIVGVDYDQSPDPTVVRRLNNAGRDAGAVYTILTERYGFAAGETAFLMTEEQGRKDGSRAPTRANVFDKLRHIAEQAGENDCILFYFAGHGCSFLDGMRGNLYPKDVKVSLGRVVAASCIDLGSVIDQLTDANSRARHRMIVLDSCNSGQLFEEMTRSRSRAPAGEDRSHFDHRALVGLTSAAAGQEASDGDDGHSPFAGALLDILKNAKPGQPLRAEHVHLRVRQQVALRASSAAKQFPFYGTRTPGTPGDFFFLPDARQVHMRDEAPAARLPETDDWLALRILPGVSGGWWFEEMPWFLPEMREKMEGLDGRRLQETDWFVPGIDGAGLPGSPRRPATVTRPIAGHYLAASPNVRGLHELLNENREQYLTNLVRTDPSRAQWLDDLLSGIEDGRHIEQADMVDMARLLEQPHLLALIQHHFGDPEAQESYEKAITRYRRSLSGDGDAHPALRGLYALCVSDLGVFHLGQHRHAHAARTFSHARRIAQAVALGPPQEIVLFEIFCITQEVAARRKLARHARDWESLDQLMDEAFELAERHLNPRHPILAHLHERRAWMLMEQWRVSEARRDFQETIRRYEECEALGFLAVAWHARRAILHGRHGLAMCMLFSGETGEARQLYRRLYEMDIPATLEGHDRYSPASRALVTRLVNTAERLADTFLMSASPEPAEALRWYRSAYADTDDLVGAAPPTATRAQLLAKKALAAALAGDDTAFVRAWEQLDAMRPDDKCESDDAAPATAQPETAAGRLTDSQWSGLRVFRKLAPPLRDLHADQSESIAEAQRVFRQLLHEELQRDPDSSPADTRGLSREMFELLLFAWGQLIASQHSDADDAPPCRQLADDAVLVFRIRPAQLQDPQVLRYLKPHYDRAVAIELTAHRTSEPRELMRHLLMAATGKDQRAPREPVVLLYFFAAEERGGAAVLYVPSQPIEVFRLAENEAQIREKSKAGAKLPLPDGLIARWNELSVPPTLLWPYDPEEEPCPYELPSST